MPTLWQAVRSSARRLCETDRGFIKKLVGRRFMRRPTFLIFIAVDTAFLFAVIPLFYFPSTVSFANVIVYPL